MGPFIHTTQEPAWQFVVSFPTKDCKHTFAYTLAHNNTCAQALFISCYSSSRRLIWKSKCSTQSGVFTSAAQGAQTAGNTAITSALSLYFFVSPPLKFSLYFFTYSLFLHSACSPSPFLLFSLFHSNISLYLYGTISVLKRASKEDVLCSLYGNVPSGTLS